LLIFYRQKVWLTKASATVGQWWQRQQLGTIITPGLGHPTKVSLRQFNIIIYLIIYLYFDYVNPTGDDAITLSGGSSGDSRSRKSKSSTGKGKYFK
jgi:hypothetical protein